MILQTTGGFDESAFSTALFALGPWCSQGDRRPDRTAQDLPSTHDLEIEATSHTILESVEKQLFPLLNEIHNVDLAPRVWKDSLGTYLRVLTPLVIARFNLIKRAVEFGQCTEFTLLDVNFSELTTNDRSELLVSINSHSWNHLLLAELCKSVGLVPRSPDRTVVLEPLDQSASQRLHPVNPVAFKKIAMATCNFIATRSRTLITRTMLPSKIDFGLARRMKTLPYFWTEDFTYSTDVDVETRRRINESITSESGDIQTLTTAIVSRLPKVFVEDFARARLDLQKRFRRVPDRVFTSNLHQSSDVFLLWLSEMHERGTRITISQHGGVHSLCRDVPADISAEIELADRYIAWGNRSHLSPKVRSGPTLVNVGKTTLERPKKSDSGTLLIVLDASYRYPSIPRGMNGSRFDYAKVIADLIDQLDSSVVRRILLRPYRGAELWDDSIVDLLPVDPRIEIDPTFPPIDSLYKSADMVVSTSLGTTFFQTIFHRVPTAILLDEKLSPLSKWASQGLQPLRETSILHSDPSGLATHINQNLTNVRQWWNSSHVRDAISLFENEMSPVCTAPVQFYFRELKNS